MRNLIVIAFMLNFLNAKASVVCEKDGRYWRPKNETAKQIASSLGVKTCTGKRFKAVVKGLGETSNVVASTKKMSVDDLIKSMKK